MSQRRTRALTPCQDNSILFSYSLVFHTPLCLPSIEVDISYSVSHLSPVNLQWQSYKSETVI
jgi:hypothetical protein